MKLEKVYYYLIEIENDYEHIERWTIDATCDYEAIAFARGQYDNVVRWGKCRNYKEFYVNKEYVFKEKNSDHRIRIEKTIWAADAKETPREILALTVYTSKLAEFALKQATAKVYDQEATKEAIKALKTTLEKIEAMQEEKQ